MPPSENSKRLGSIRLLQNYAASHGLTLKEARDQIVIYLDHFIHRTNKTKPKAPTDDD